MDQAARGKKALADGKYDEAITEFTAALKISPTSPDYLIQRSTANQRAKKYADALADANNAVLNAQKRAKRELIVEAQFRRGCALYSLERYGDAEFVFGVVKRMDEKHKMLPTWAQKTKMSLDKLDAGDARRNCAVKETPSLEEASSGSSDSKSSEPAHAPGTNGAYPSTTAASQQAAPQQTAPDKIRHDWYQNNDNVYFTLLVKGVPKDKAQIEIQQRSLTISFPLATGSSYDFTLEPLFGAVSPERSTSKVLSTKIEVVLAKSTPSQKWGALESNEPVSCSTDSTATPAVIHPATKTDQAPAYPTSSRTGPKNWDQIVKTTTTDNGQGVEDDEFEGGDEANHFFKKLFKDASPDVQRAMMKSYTESNGTALSTNWEEVKKGPVETLPPDGMEARKW